MLYVLFHHVRRPYAVGPYMDYEKALQCAGVVLQRHTTTTGDLLYTTRTPGVSIVEATPKDGRIGRCTIYPPQPID